MTENKFGVITNWCIYENVDGIKKWLNFDEVVDLLNALNDENEQLKQQLADEFNQSNCITVQKSKIMDLEKENEQLKQSISHYADITACSVEVMNEDDELKNDYASILCTKMEKVVKENEQLKQTIEEFRAYDKRDYIESEHINNIYKEFGFDGVIEEVKSRLVYGTVTEMDNLIRISTGGWSDDEALLDVLISPMTRFHYHYVGYLVGGAFYFDKDKSFESFRKIRLIKDLEKGDVE